MREERGNVIGNVLEQSSVAHSQYTAGNLWEIYSNGLDKVRIL